MLEIVLLIFASAALSYEIVFSELAHLIKGIFFLDREQPVLELLSAPKAFLKLLGKWITFPPITLLAVLIMVLANLHRYLYKLLQCPYCTSFQLAFWIAFLLLGQQALASVLIAGASLFATALYNLIRNQII